MWWLEVLLISPADCETSRCQLLELIEKGFTGYFTFEMLIKMIAMGVTGPKGYLSDMWNRFDFLIVIVSLIDLLPFNLTGGLNSLRAFRALRPLRAVTKVTCSHLIDTPCISDCFRNRDTWRESA